MLWLLSTGTETVIAEIDTLNFIQTDRVVKITQSGTTTTITLAHGDNTTDLAIAGVSARDVFRKIARQEAARRVAGA
tara:strand:+ start:938 stop:1168 length:231 start_codon:yes stop_codon:yes gene_type:complete